MEEDLDWLTPTGIINIQEDRESSWLPMESLKEDLFNVCNKVWVSPTPRT